jgi:predicted acetyltransferase
VFGGHIGYDIRPSRRHEGLGTRMLRMVLPFAKSIGIDPAMLTCDVNNVGSRRMIEACGGRIECEFEYEGTQRLRWWLPTS